jgi:uncharacterized membrane-anchored protein YhcB (DUF1043 family)
MIEKITSSPILRYIAILIAGVAIGALFYPTKRIEERVSSKYEEEITHLKQEHEQSTKKLTEELTKTKEQQTHITRDYEQKITQLTTQISHLKSSTKTSYYKIVRPDGTVEIKKFSENDVSESTTVITQIQQEFKEKIDEIEVKWEKIHKERVEKLHHDYSAKEAQYQSKISELEKSKVTEINPRKLGLELGLLSNRDYYLHANADVFGPLFIGVHSQIGLYPSLGGGLGIRF